MDFHSAFASDPFVLILGSQDENMFESEGVDRCFQGECDRRILLAQGQLHHGDHARE